MYSNEKIFLNTSILNNVLFVFHHTPDVDPYLQVHTEAASYSQVCDVECFKNYKMYVCLPLHCTCILAMFLEAQLYSIHVGLWLIHHLRKTIFKTLQYIPGIPFFCRRQTVIGGSNNLLVQCFAT